MIWFWTAAGLLTVVALTALLRPLLRGSAGAPDRNEPLAAMYRRQLAGIDSDAEQGRIAAEEAAEARAEITRRMLAAADQEKRSTAAAEGSPRETSRRIGAALSIAAVLPVSALVIYFAVGAPAAIDPTLSGAAARQAPHDKAELSAVADQLKARLLREPGHKEGWVLLGRTFASLGRLAEAREAYGRAIALAPNEPELHAEIGELLVLAARGSVTPEAEAEFAKSAGDPRARFYGAEAALQRGDSAAAEAGLRSLLADAPKDASWRNAVADRLAEISGGERQSGVAAPAGAPSAGPTAQDVAAAQAMSPEERQAMIRGMVGRLAARLEQNPGDKEGWARLAHAYDVLGEKDKAEAARARAEAAAAAPPASPLK